MPKPNFVPILFRVGLCLAVAMIAAPFAVRANGNLEFEQLAAGSGPVAAAGDIVTIHLSGWLVNAQGGKGAGFIDTGNLGQPIAFKLGTDRVMPAWNQTVAGMRVGGKRRVLVPSAQGYGADGVEGLVPPNTDLIFEIELLDVKKD